MVTQLPDMQSQAHVVYDESAVMVDNPKIQFRDNLFVVADRHKLSLYHGDEESPLLTTHHALFQTTDGEGHPIAVFCAPTDPKEQYGLQFFIARTVGEHQYYSGGLVTDAVYPANEFLEEFLEYKHRPTGWAKKNWEYYENDEGIYLVSSEVDFNKAFNDNKNKDEVVQIHNLKDGPFDSRMLISGVLLDTLNNYLKYIDDINKKYPQIRVNSKYWVHRCITGSFRK